MQESLSSAFEGLTFESFSQSPNQGRRKIFFTSAFIFLYPPLHLLSYIWNQVELPCWNWMSIFRRWYLALGSDVLSISRKSYLSKLGVHKELLHKPWRVWMSQLPLNSKIWYIFVIVRNIICHVIEFQTFDDSMLINDEFGIRRH